MAGTKKKKKPVKRKSTKKPEKEKLMELDGWTVGDMAWAKTMSGETIHGTISDLYNVEQVVKGENLGFAASLITEPDKKFRTVLISALSDSKPKRVKKK